MAAIQNALVCAALALAMWGFIGFAIGRYLLPRRLALPLSPLLGWATHSVVAFPLFCFIGMTKPTVAASAAAAIGASVLFHFRYGRRSGASEEFVGVPVSAMIGACLLGCAVMMAVMPTVTSDGAMLAAPIFDHSKIAMIDDMARLGVPAGNPFIGGSGDGLPRLPYYYLWHFAAAEIAILGGFSGWEADAGMTCFTAASSLMLMMGLAVWLGSRASSAFWVLAVAATSSIRDLLSLAFGWRIIGTISGWPTGFGGWLFQVTWAPQHVASAGCVVIAILLLVRMAERPDWRLPPAMSLVSAAAFESSTWVGGISYPLAATVTGVFLLIQIAPDQRLRFVASAVVATLLSIAMSSLFVHDQLRASILRADGSPISVSPYEVLGEPIPEALRALLDLPAYWTSLLFVEFAAFYPLGFVFAGALSRDRPSSECRTVVISFSVLAVVSLAVGGMLVSTVAANNDLAWRGVLPGILVLIAFTAAGLGRYLPEMPRLYAVAALAVVALALVSGARDLYKNFEIKPQASAKQFSDSVQLWAAVRRNSARGERVVNNPGFLADMTRWPINISWALLAHRRSCYAGPDLALPFAPMTRKSRAKAEEAFTRLFAGKADRDEVDRLAAAFDCSLVVVTPNDGAWTTGPLAENSPFQLVDSKLNAWRIYRMRTNSPG
jgi:hypothetical protein